MAWYEDLFENFGTTLASGYGGNREKIEQQKDLAKVMQPKEENLKVDIANKKLDPDSADALYEDERKKLWQQSERDIDQGKVDKKMAQVNDLKKQFGLFINDLKDRADLSDEQKLFLAKHRVASLATKADLPVDTFEAFLDVPNDPSSDTTSATNPPAGETFDFTGQEGIEPIDVPNDPPSDTTSGKVRGIGSGASSRLGRLAGKLGEMGTPPPSTGSIFDSFLEQATSDEKGASRSLGLAESKEDKASFQKQSRLAQLETETLEDAKKTYGMEVLKDPRMALLVGQQAKATAAERLSLEEAERRGTEQAVAQQGFAKEQERLALQQGEELQKQEKRRQRLMAPKLEELTALHQDIQNKELDIGNFFSRKTGLAKKVDEYYIKKTGEADKLASYSLAEIRNLEDDVGQAKERLPLMSGKNKSDTEAEIAQKEARIAGLKETLTSAEKDRDEMSFRGKLRPDVMNITGKVMMFIGAAILEVYTGKGLALLGQLIDNDIEAQKMELQQAKDTFSAQRDLIGEMRTIFDDDRAVEAAARATQWQAIQARLEGMKAASQNVEFLNRIDTLSASIETKKAEQLNTAIQFENDSTTKKIQLQADIEYKRGMLDIEWAKVLREKEKKKNPISAGSVSRIAAALRAIETADGILRDHTGDGEMAGSEGFGVVGGIFSGIGAAVTGSRIGIPGQRLETKIDQLVYDLIHAESGAQVSDQEFQRRRKLAPHQSSTEEYGVDQLKIMRNKSMAALRGIIDTEEANGKDTDELRLKLQELEQLGVLGQKSPSSFR